MTDASHEGETLAAQLALRVEPVVPVRRMPLDQVNARAVERALANARSLDWNAIDAIEANVALGRLFSATLSPLILRSGMRSGVGLATFPVVRRLVAREHLRKDEASRGVAKTARYTASTLTAELTSLGFTEPAWQHASYVSVRDEELVPTWSAFMVLAVADGRWRR